MIQTRKLTLSTPLAICMTVCLGIAFVMTVALGIWMNHAVENLNNHLAAQLKVAHLVSGLVFIILASVHIWRNRGWWASLFTAESDTWRSNAYKRVAPIFLLTFLCVTVTAIMVMCGNRSVVAFHCGTALLFSVLAVFHITLNIGSVRKE